jgi:hypothetical protein
MSELKYNFGGIDGAASGSSDYAGSHSLYQDVFIPSANADSTQSGDDINIGVGELQECIITKSIDASDAFDFTTVPTAPEPFEVKMEEVILSSWNSGDSPDTTGGDVAIESITLVHEGFDLM